MVLPPVLYIYTSYFKISVEKKLLNNELKKKKHYTKRIF